MKRLFALLFLLALIVGTALILSASKYRTTQGYIFGTSYQVKYAATVALDAEILDELQRIDSSLSMFNDSSTLARFNAGVAIPHDEMLLETARLSQSIAQATGGAFDITVAPLVNAWGFGFKHRQSLTPRQVDSIRNHVGYRKLVVEKHRLVKQDPQLTIDMGAVAKGYAVDRIARLLSQRGCRHYMVEIGGEVSVKGNNPDGKPWTLGINRPDDDSTGTRHALHAVLRLTNRSVATSGNYRNFYYRNGRKFAHTIDPRTGYPVDHSLLSATVIAPSCAQADALATAFMVMGTDSALAFARRQSQIDTYLIYADEYGKLHVRMSEGMKKHLQP